MDSPLTTAELAELESSLLPALERHHLRLLAHGLRTLQAIAGRNEGPPPTLEAIETWVLEQPAIAGDAPFARAFAGQLLATGDQLSAIGAASGRSALALELHELIAWAKAQADGRLQTATSATPTKASNAAANPNQPG